MSARVLRDAAAAVRAAVGVSVDQGMGFVGLTEEAALLLADWLEASSLVADVEGLDQGRPLEELDADFAAAVVFADRVASSRPDLRLTFDPDDVFGPNQDGGA